MFTLYGFKNLLLDDRPHVKGQLQLPSISKMEQYSKILPMVLSNFLMAYCLEISKQNLITRVSWIRLLATLSQSKDLN
jgi:hypothetical protein